MALCGGGLSLLSGLIRWGTVGKVCCLCAKGTLQAAEAGKRSTPDALSLSSGFGDTLALATGPYRPHATPRVNLEESQIDTTQRSKP